VFISSVHIKNIRCIQEIQWRLPYGRARGWHVIIGDNGTGKSTFLRALALFLVGPIEAVALRQDWEHWMRRGQSSGTIRADIKRDAEFDPFRQVKSGQLDSFSTPLL
jgi:predicted ATP-dependent endonuclease of OLD family